MRLCNWLPWHCYLLKKLRRQLYWHRRPNCDRFRCHFAYIRRSVYAYGHDVNPHKISHVGQHLSHGKSYSLTSVHPAFTEKLSGQSNQTPTPCMTSCTVSQPKQAIRHKRRSPFSPLSRSQPPSEHYCWWLSFTTTLLACIHQCNFNSHLLDRIL